MVGVPALIPEKTACSNSQIRRYETRQGERSGNEGERGRSLRHWVRLPDGRTLYFPVSLRPNRQARREGMAERAHRAREGWSWKEDIRDRVDMALRVFVDVGDLEALLKVAGVDVSYAADGEIKFRQRGSGMSVRGGTLDAPYTLESIGGRLAARAAERARGGGMPKGVDDRLREVMAEAEPGTREGAELLRDVATVADRAAEGGYYYYEELLREGDPRLPPRSGRREGARCRARRVPPRGRGRAPRGGAGEACPARRGRGRLRLRRLLAGSAVERLLVGGPGACCLHRLP